MDKAIRVLIVDDHAVVRAGLTKILATEPGIAIVGEAGDGLEAIKKALELRPDVILMDIFMPHCSGLEATVVIRQQLADARLLILTVSDREEDLLQALRFGAQGYLLKSAAITEVAEAVRRVAAGEAMLSPHIITRLVAEFRGKSDVPALSAREGEVLELLAGGLTNSEIASRLILGESTVRTYLRRLLDKLQLKNRSEAVAYAARNVNRKPLQGIS